MALFRCPITVAQRLAQAGISAAKQKDYAT